jgi:NADH-quinone oxidoreductase subunit L
MKLLTLICVFTPLVGCILSGFFRKQIGRIGAHSITILGLLISFSAAVKVACGILPNGFSVNIPLYTFASGESWFPYELNIGFLIDPLSVVMMLIVTFVSLLVHVYSIGYMSDDDGYQRFFSYISLFTFMMLMLVTGNNFMQLFFGWEGVGLVSYLLIGFWYQKESAIEGSLKAFLVNRVGDFGFVLGIALILVKVGSLDYSAFFFSNFDLLGETLSLGIFGSVSLVTLICILLFIGAMGKSAQVPLHVWLPESMEGPTPISALIHAATMVTAGIFMIARLSPLFELSATARTVIIVIGGTGALFMGLIGIVMNDIKRVVAYSTLSQLGYMMVALGSSSYSVGVFHLLTHACFKALLFLGAGSVIIGMHHEQDMTKMGGLKEKMPITFVTYFIGCLALCAFPPFAGFFSKDTIIQAAHHAKVLGHSYANFCVSVGAMVTAFYTFRSLFMTFYGKFRGDHHTWEHCHESPLVVWLPLVILAIPSIIIGWVLYGPMVLNHPGLLGSSVAAGLLFEHPHNAFDAILEGCMELPFWLTLIGTFAAWICYVKLPHLPAKFTHQFQFIYRVLMNKFGFDSFNETVWVKGTKKLGTFFFNTMDQKIIDGYGVNGAANSIGKSATLIRYVQSGYLSNYISMMIIGLMLIIFWFLVA